MKSTLDLLAAALAATLALPALADTQTVNANGVPAQIRCNTLAGGQPVFAVHADKIIFKLSGALPAINGADQAALDLIPRNSELDIKVLDDPLTIADLKGKVLSFIGAVDNANTRVQVSIVDVDYAMVCPLKPFALPD